MHHSSAIQATLAKRTAPTAESATPSPVRPSAAPTRPASSGRDVSVRSLARGCSTPFAERGRRSRSDPEEAQADAVADGPPMTLTADSGVAGRAARAASVTICAEPREGADRCRRADSPQEQRQIDEYEARR